MLAGILHVKLEETVDKSDWKLLAWTEKSIVPEWINVIVDDYETDKLEKCGIDIEKSMNFLKKGKFILGEGLFKELAPIPRARSPKGMKSVIPQAT